MADLAPPRLVFHGGCPDCGTREVALPSSLPDVGDDFDWLVRDYDGFRLSMLEELAARFPERRRWTPADIEVVVVEVLAAVLDQLSDAADRVAAESTLETARQPESVYHLLRLIGYDAAAEAALTDDPADAPEARTAWDKLRTIWNAEPLQVEAARAAGPRAIRRQQRMATLEDYAVRLREHPLIQGADAALRWSGSWPVVRVAVIGWNDRSLDALPDAATYPDDLRRAVERFHRERRLVEPNWELQPTIRTVVRRYVDAYRMAGQDVELADVDPIGIVMAMSVRVKDNAFQSEVRRAIQEALGQGPGGFFHPGRLRFGEDVQEGDIIQTLMQVGGVQHVCVTRLKRIGRQHPDEIGSGRVRLVDLELAVCDNNPETPERGYYTLTLHGGRRG